MITKTQRAILEAAHNRVVNAEVADSWSGAGDPAGVAECELELLMAKIDWKEFLDQLESGRV